MKQQRNPTSQDCSSSSMKKICRPSTEYCPHGSYLSCNHLKVFQTLEVHTNMKPSTPRPLLEGRPSKKIEMKRNLELTRN